jgi:hypothetical protein
MISEHAFSQTCMCDSCIDQRTRNKVKERERNKEPELTPYEIRRGGRVPENSRRKA